MSRVYLSLGSNVDAGTHVRLGVRELRRRFGPIDVSPVYRNKAVGFEGEDFLNLVVGFDTEAPIASILEEIGAIHALAGREREADRFVPRTLDIDLLLYGDVVTDGPPVRLPRRDVLDYSFVLKPLADLAPGDRHPVTGDTYAAHWRALAAADPHELEEVDLEV